MRNRQGAENFMTFASFVTGSLNRLREYRRDHFIETALDLRVVGYSPGDRDAAGASRRNALFNQAPGIDQHARAGAFLQAMFAQRSDLMAELGEQCRAFVINTRFVADNLGFTLGIRKLKVEGDESLSRAVF